MRRLLRSGLRAAATLAVFAAGVLGAVGLAGATSAATPLDGKWRGAHLYSISGTLEGGFTINAAESFTVVGCPVNSGAMLAELTPAGGGNYAQRYAWIVSSSSGGQLTCTNSVEGPETVNVALSGSTLRISGCGYGFCDAMTRVSTTPTTTKPATTAPRPTTTAPTTTGPPQAKDTSPPRVEALPKGLTKPGTRDTLRFTVKDDSGRAKFHATLYQGGTPIKSESRWDDSANARQKWSWPVLFASDLVGPLFFCVWAEDAAGNRSAGAPKSSCEWISLLVRVERVSNGCGGGVATWDVGVVVQNYFGNEHTYFDFGSGLKYTVNFADACNLHDAGYGGHTVKDKLRPGKQGIKDFRGWTRRKVDTKFLNDLRLLCNKGIPASAEGARAKCIEGAAYYALPVNHLIGAETLYGFVHKFGDAFFDSDLTRPGNQRAAEKSGSRDSFDFG